MRVHAVVLVLLAGLAMHVSKRAHADPSEPIDRSANRAAKVLTHDGRPIKNWYFTDNPFYSGAPGKNLMLFIEKKGRSESPRVPRRPVGLSQAVAA